MNLIDRLRGGLIVSVQAREGSALDDPLVIAALAAAAADSGAVAVRIQGVANLQAVRKRVTVPIVGLIKRKYDGYEPYITPTLREVDEILGCGAEIVAFDATGRPRPAAQVAEQLVARILESGAIPMADCAQPADGVAACAMGALILATTLCGYTRETAGTVLPAFELVAQFAELDAFCVCEGGVHTPEMAARSLAAGAQAVVVGSAISDTDWLVRQFAAALRERPRKS